ncbi:MAG: hypothetical protein E7313_06850 [Clostridiales bacterium]|nr:hypothetical protein [Clostridiales bacterium]
MQKEKSIGRNILIVVLILVTIASVCAGLFAWAKYQTTINGTATGETAKWSFKVSDGDTSTQEIDFPMTRKDNNTSVAEGKIAPGTYGELQIGIDAAGTETALTYVIEGTIENRPTNMKFYSDAERTQELTILDNKFSKGGYMKLNEVGARTETIYWEWPFETGSTTETINKNDIIDTEDSEKTISMEVSVTGKQLNGNPVLADLVQVGDYVGYDASSNGYKTFTANDCVNIEGIEEENKEGYKTFLSVSDTITTEQDFNSEAKAQWRVLSVDRNTGVVELMAADPTTQSVTLKGSIGFKYGEEVLNSIGAIYGQGKGATSGRSMKLEDVEPYVIGFDPKSSMSAYNTTKTYTSGNFFEETKDNNGNVIGYGDTLKSEPTTMTHTFYIIKAKEYIKNTTVYNMLLKQSADITQRTKTFWLASRCVYLYSGSCGYGLRCINGGDDGVQWGDMYKSTESNGGTRGPDGWRAMPVVTLNTNIQTTGQNADGVWQLKVD